MSNLDKVNEALVKDPETAKKLAEEMMRLAEGRKDVDVKAIMAEAARTVFGLDLTDEELEAALATSEKTDAAPGEAEKLDDDALDQVAGGYTPLSTGQGLALMGYGLLDVVGNFAEAMNLAALGSPLGYMGNSLIAYIKTGIDVDKADKIIREL